MLFLAKEYLEYIRQEIFPSNAPPELQSGTFLGRFNPDKYNLKNSEIAEELKHREGKDYISGFNQHLKEVIKKINSRFREELDRDGVTEQQLGLGQTGDPGRYISNTKSPWQVAYQWLWEKKYDRWLQDYIWDSWKQKAQTNLEWIQFSDRPSECSSKGMGIPLPLPKESLPINTPLSLKINLDSPGKYLLLFNRGLDTQGNRTKYLVTPSQAFAPSYQLVEKSTLLPMQGAVRNYIDFDSAGEEEYIGIVIDKALDLPWLNPTPHIVEWEGRHLEQVWEHLHAQDNWRVFYQDFNVVRD